MAEYIIRGGKPLYGEIAAQGSKNSAVAILMACITVRGVVILRRIPYVTDVLDCIQILRSLGARVEWLNDGGLLIDCTDLEYCMLSSDITRRIRASTYLMGSCLSRFGRCRLLEHGGCALGKRPIDIHLDVLRKIGMRENGDMLSLASPYGEAEFSRVTVGGTVNALLATVCGDGECIFTNCAKEPHVCDIVRFLNSCGANITGCGEDRLVVKGVKELIGCEFSLSGDMIEAGTYILAGAVTGGSVTVRGIIPDELASLGVVLSKMGFKIECLNDRVSVSGYGSYGVSVETGEYPFFPTDLHPQLVALMGSFYEEYSLRERVFGADRFAYLNELVKFGGRFEVIGDTVSIFGGKYSPSNVVATDLRGGAAMVIAALCANGESRVGKAEFIERG